MGRNGKDEDYQCVFGFERDIACHDFSKRGDFPDLDCEGERLSGVSITEERGCVFGDLRT